MGLFPFFSLNSQLLARIYRPTVLWASNQEHVLIGQKAVLTLGGQPVTSALPDSNPEIINLVSLKDRFLGNTDLLDRVLQTFTETLDADLKVLEQAIRAANAETALFCAHRIKGMAASVEARNLWKSASITEDRAKNKCLDKLAGCLTQLYSDQKTLVEVLKLEGCNIS